MYEKDGCYLGSHIQTGSYVSLVYISLNSLITFFSYDTNFFEAFKNLYCRRFLILDLPNYILLLSIFFGSSFT